MIEIQSTWKGRKVGNKPRSSNSKPDDTLLEDSCRQKAMAEKIIAARLRLSKFAVTNSVENVLQKTLDEVCEITASPIGFYHFVEADQKTLSLQMWSTRTLDQFCTAEGKGLHYDVDQAGVWVDCIHEGKPVIHNDYPSLEHKKGYPGGHAEIKREAVMPILRGHKIVAILGVGNKPTPYKDDDIDILTVFANLAWDIVEIKITETRLKQNESLLNATQALTKVGGWEWDVRSQKMFWTDEVYRIHGFLPEEIAPGSTEHIARSLQCYDPADRPVILATFEKCAEQGEAYDLEFPFTRVTGERIWIRTVARPIRENGRIVKVLGNLMDITELKSALEKAKEKEKSHQLSLDAARAGTWMWDINTGEVVWDDQMQRIFGLQPGTFDGSFEAWKNCVHPEDLPAAEKATLRAMKRGERYEQEYRVKGLSGEWRIVNAQAATLLDDDGRPGRMSGFATDITERKREERAIRDSAEKYRSILQTATDGFWITDSQGAFLEVNDAYVQMSGYSKEELLTMNIADIEASENPAQVAGHLRMGIERGFERFESTHRRKNNSLIQVEVNFRYLSVEGGIFVVFLKDITERKLAEAALRESETKFRSMFEQAPLSYQSLDEQGNFTEVNQTWLHTMGYSREEVIGKNFSEFLMPEWKEHFKQNFPRFKAVGEVLGVEFEMVKKDGSSIIVSFHGKIGRDKKGNFERTHCVFRDISLEKTAEEALKRESELNKAAADISKVLLAEIYDFTKVSELTLNYAKELTGSAHGFVSSIDKTTLENVGHTLTDMFGKQCRMKDQRIAFPIGPDGKYDALWGHVLNTRKAFYTNQPVKHPSAKGLPQGHIPLGNFLAVPVLIDNHLAGMVALANSNRDYSHKDIEIIERLSDIFAFALHRNRYEMDKTSMEKQLQQMQKLEAIGTLAGGIAHDFNNILFPIVGMSEMLLEDLPPGSPQYENADEILRAGKRGSDLVKQILAFSRQTEHKIIPLRIQSILKEVIKLTRSSIPSDIQIRKRIQADCELVLADPTQLHQIAMNLLTNAFHAVENQGGEIEVQLAETEIGEDDFLSKTLSPGRYARMTVSDTGTGIEPAMLDKIFEPYFTTKAQGKGTGLGLAVVHGIVKEFRGDIEVISTVGEGTTFHIYLPLLRRDEAIPDSNRDNYSELGSGHILLVDDERVIVQLEKQMLERLGYDVTTRLNSAEALEAFRARPAEYDLVITDMTMPDMTGDQLSRELMSIRPDLPIIICTGFSERIDHEKAKAIGIKGFLLKPVVKSEMARMVRMALDEANSKS